MPVLESDDFVACYQQHYARLVRALELAGAPRPAAEDHAQEAFARMLARWHRVRRGSNPAGYAYRTAFRLLGRGRVDVVTTPLPVEGDGRPEGRSPNVPASVLVSPSAGALDVAVTSQVTADAVLAAMPPRRRACAVMCLVVGCSTGDAATALGIAEGTVRKHLADARVDLRSVLAE